MTKSIITILCSQPFLINFSYFFQDCRTPLTVINFLLFFCSPHRDLTLHGNRWHCDCNLLGLRSWLRGRALPWPPKCGGPPRLIGEEVAPLPSREFACRPEVSPTNPYLEVIEGKNISLVCTVKVRNKKNLFCNLPVIYDRPAPTASRKDAKKNPRLVPLCKCVGYLARNLLLAINSPSFSSSFSIFERKKKSFLERENEVRKCCLEKMVWRRGREFPDIQATGMGKWDILISHLFHFASLPRLHFRRSLSEDKIACLAQCFAV